MRGLAMKSLARRLAVLVPVDCLWQAMRGRHVLAAPADPFNGAAPAFDAAAAALISAQSGRLGGGRPARHSDLHLPD